MKKILLLMLVVISVVITGCSFFQKDKPEPPKQISFTIYRAAADGSEKLIPEKFTMTDNGKALPENALLALVGAKPQGTQFEDVIPHGTRVLSFSITPEGTALANFSKEIVKNGQGSYNEVMMTGAIVNTLTEFPEVKQVQILVEGNELVVNYKKEQEKSKEKIGNVKKDGFGEVLGGLLNVDLKLDLFNEEEPVDTIAATDTVPAVSTKIIDTYKISMHFDGFKMYGSMTHQIIEKDTIERMISESVDLLELFKAPDDYLGYTYKPSGLLSEMPELKNLYTRKLQAAVSDASALNDLGCMYVLGIGVRRNLKMAVSKFDEARVKKNLFATLNLANLYVNAIGVEQNLPKAREYYKQIHALKFPIQSVLYF